MKGGLLLLSWLFLGMRWVHADDYQDQLKQLHERSRLIDRRMARLGFSSAEEKAVASRKEEGEPHSLLTIHSFVKTLQAQTGRVLVGQTIHRLVVSSEGSPAVIEFGDNQGVFSGLRVLGKARISSAPGRLQIDFDRLVLRSGKVIAVQASALDEQGAYGLPAQAMSGKVWAIAGALGSSFIAGLAASQQAESVTPFGFAQTERSGRNSILQGVAQTAADQSKRFIDEATQEKPILIVEKNSVVNLYFNEEVRF